MKDGFEFIFKPTQLRKQSGNKIDQYKILKQKKKKTQAETKLNKK